MNSANKSIGGSTLNLNDVMTLIDISNAHSKENDELKKQIEEMNKTNCDMKMKFNLQNLLFVFLIILVIIHKI